MASDGTDFGFPPDFDAEFYRAGNSDLRHFSDDKLWAHFQDHGRGEGRVASRGTGRHALLSYIPPTARVLEIGPFADPAVAGPNVTYFDVLSTEALKARAVSVGKNPATVPHVHFVSPVADLSIVGETFDVVVSSHSIEHQPDLVTHCRSVARLLAPGGCYLVIAPDCRYCFDHYLPPSSIAEILDAHYTGRRVHTLASIIEHRAMTVHSETHRYWNGGFDPLVIEPARVRAAIAEWQRSAGGYVDVHAWQFTPASFRGIVQLLRELDEIALQPIRVYDTPRGSAEFCAVLAAG